VFFNTQQTIHNPLTTSAPKISKSEFSIENHRNRNFSTGRILGRNGNAELPDRRQMDFPFLADCKGNAVKTKTTDFLATYPTDSRKSHLRLPAAGRDLPKRRN
jgi:hypothetical protein